MSRVRLLGILAIALAVLVLVGSLISGLATGDGAEPVSGGGGGRDRAPRAEDRVRVEVLNAAGVSGLAREATRRLRSAGYDVVYYGNAQSFGRDTSVVLDRVGRPDAARGVARAMDIPVVLVRPDTTLYLDVTVIIGGDWSGIPAAADTTTPAPTI